jgi:hypothetical protein
MRVLRSSGFATALALTAAMLAHVKAEPPPTDADVAAPLAAQRVPAGLRLTQLQTYSVTAAPMKVAPPRIQAAPRLNVSPITSPAAQGTLESRIFQLLFKLQQSKKDEGEDKDRKK